MPDESELTGAYVATPQPLAERFAPGTLLDGRYRLVAALGKGGMGEVYRADDLTLAQPVALKFLPQHLSGDPDRLARFRKEVAAARKVSHPHVCRVYDIVEHEGQSFLTMEFVDGEDLSSVLKRLGRVPEEKGIEIAKQLCSALAAVHDQGLLHRDLKPANVMLDGRGKVRLTDFGLAAAAEDLSITEVRSGTPLYQAPEQIAGKEVAVRSDLYALGLVLYELFTGKRAFGDAKRDATPSKPTSHVSALNPTVERVILRCLEADPTNRPRSATEVLAGLPGGDPLAAALAAGETPSPQLVADAGGTGLIRPRTGMLLLAATIAAVVGVMALADHIAPYSRARLTDSPAEMSRKARLTLAALGYTETPADSTGGYLNDDEWLAYTSRTDPNWARSIALGQPAAMHYFHRESPLAILPINSQGIASPDDPPVSVPGMTGVRLDPRGRLVELRVVPPAHIPGYTTTAGDDWWKQLFTIAGLKPGDFTPAPPEWTPPAAFDTRRAWVGRFPDRLDVEIRVEAAAYNGKPTSFRLIGRWTPTRSPFASSPIVFVVSLSVTALGLLLAVRNVRRGRADTRGAIRIVLGYGAAYILVWLIGGHHVREVLGEWQQLLRVVGTHTVIGSMLAVCYLAIEPAVRRRWPWQLTAWGRLVDGRLRDSMIGRDLLIGLALGAAVVLALAATAAAGEAVGLPVHSNYLFTADWAGPIPRGMEHPVWALSQAFAWSILYMCLTYVLFLVVRRASLAWGLGAIFIWLPLVAALGPSVEANVLNGLCQALLIGCHVILLARVGLVAGTSFQLATLTLTYSLLTLNPAVWYFGTSTAIAGGLLTLAVFGCWTATGGVQLFREGFFGDD